MTLTLSLGTYVSDIPSNYGLPLVKIAKFASVGFKLSQRVDLTSDP